MYQLTRFIKSPLVWISATMLLAVLLLINYLYVPEQRSTVTNVEYTVANRDLDFYVNERGYVRPANVITVKSDIDSNKAQLVWLRAEGDEVEIGEEIARFDTTPLEDIREKKELEYTDRIAQLESAKKQLVLEVENQKSKIETARKSVQLAKIKREDIEFGSGLLERSRILQNSKRAARNVELAASELKDFELLLEKGHVSKRERDKIAENLRTLNETLKISQAEWKNYNKYKLPSMLNESQMILSSATSEYQRVLRTSEIELQQKKDNIVIRSRSLKKTEDKLKSLDKSLSNCRIVAPINGTLLYTKLPRPEGRRKSRVGDSVWVGQTFLEIPDTTQMVVDIHVREIDVAKLKLGDKAEIKFDAYTNIVHQGEVVKIEKIAREDDPSDFLRKFNVSVKIFNSDIQIHSGMSAEVKIHYKHLNNVMAVPVSAIKYKFGKPTVLIMDKSKEQKNIFVEIGSSNNQWVEITAGISTGEKIVVMK